MKKIVLIVLVTFLALLFAGSVAANDASMGRKGETVYPMEETDVRMVSEDIYVKYNSGARGHVTCEFVFHNESEAKTVLMGFPAEEKIYSTITTADNVRLHDFTANLNGIPIEVKEIPGTEMEGDYSKYPSWYVFEVPFKAGETLIMTHEYDVSFTGYSTGQVIVGYILETGSTWGGSIGHSKVTFDLSEIETWGIGTYYTPQVKDFRYENGMLIFEKWDFIPDFNLEVYVSFYAAKNFTDRSDWPISEEDTEIKDFFNEISGKTVSQLIEAYNNLSYKKKFIETVYLNTVLGISDQPYTPIATKMEARGSKGFWIYVKDRNYDMEDNATITMNGYYNNVIYSGKLHKTNSFGEYGTVVYSYSASEERLKEAIANKLIASYVITVVDEDGNESYTVFAGDDFENNRATIKSGTADDGSEEYIIENPPTSTQMDYMTPAIIIFFIGLILMHIKTHHHKRFMR